MKRGIVFFGLASILMIMIRVLLWATGLAILLSETSFVLFIILSHFLALFTPIILYKLITENNFYNIFPIKPISFKNIIFICIMLVCTYPVVIFLQLILFLFYESTFDYYYLLWGELKGYPFILIILAVAVSPAIFEELVFRGILQYEFRDIPIKKAALFNGLLFGIIHLNLPQFIAAFILGTVLAYLMHYTGNLLVPILGHFFWNSMATIHQIYYDSIYPREHYFGPNNPIADMIIWGGIALVSGYIAFVLMKKFIAHNKSNIDAEVVNSA